MQTKESCGGDDFDNYCSVPLSICDACSYHIHRFDSLSKIIVLKHFFQQYRSGRDMSFWKLLLDISKKSWYLMRWLLHWSMLCFTCFLFYHCWSLYFMWLIKNRFSSFILSMNALMYFMYLSVSSMAWNCKEKLLWMSTKDQLLLLFWSMPTQNRLLHLF